MKGEPTDCIYCLVEKGFKMSEMKDANFLVGYLGNGYANYASAEEAEAGRQNGDAYDNPGKTRVVGFKITPFLPKKNKKKGSK